MTQDTQRMIKDCMVHAQSCSDLCETMAPMLSECSEDSFKGMTDTEVMTFAADCTTAIACLSRCQTMLVGRA